MKKNRHPSLSNHVAGERWFQEGQEYWGKWQGRKCRDQARRSGFRIIAAHQAARRGCAMNTQVGGAFRG